MVRVHDVVIIGGGTSGTFAALRLAGEGVDTAVISGGPPSALMSRGAAFCGRSFPDDHAFERLWRTVLPDMWKEKDAYLGFDGSVVPAARSFAGSASVSAGPPEMPFPVCSVCSCGENALPSPWRRGSGSMNAVLRELGGSPTWPSLPWRGGGP